MAFPHILHSCFLSINPLPSQLISFPTLLSFIYLSDETVVRLLSFYYPVPPTRVYLGNIRDSSRRVHFLHSEQHLAPGWRTRQTTTRWINEQPWNPLVSRKGALSPGLSFRTCETRPRHKRSPGFLFIYNRIGPRIAGSVRGSFPRRYLRAMWTFSSSVN